MCFYIAANMTTWWKHTGIIFIFFSSSKGIFLPYFPSLSHSYWPYNTLCIHTSPCWVCHVTWQNTSSHFFFLSAKQPVAWIAVMLDLIRAVPIWISKETDVPTAAEFVTHPHFIEPSRCPWRRVYTEPHMNTHTRGKNWGGGGTRSDSSVIRWFLCCKFWLALVAPKKRALRLVGRNHVCRDSCSDGREEGGCKMSILLNRLF